MVFWSRSRTGDAPPSRGQGAGIAMVPDDAALVAAARSNPHAFGPLYERYVEPVYRYCYVRLGCREAAEDATGEVFAKALAGLARSGDGVFAAWLFRIAHNVVVDQHRRRRPVEPLEGAGDLLDPDPTPEEEAVAQAECLSLRAALAALPEAQRLAVELKLAGWSGEQIAATLGRSPAAVKQLRFRALGQLRTVLAEDEGDRP
jgi:RNA polymerase sigma-70 factor (ECF subfamily)